jgi:hypothetical protein
MRPRGDAIPGVRRSAPDGRARLVRPTARGWRAVDTGVEVIAAFDGWLEEQLSAAGVARLRRDLHLILEAEIP